MPSCLRMGERPCVFRFALRCGAWAAVAACLGSFASARTVEPAAAPACSADWRQRVAHCTDEGEAYQAGNAAGAARTASLRTRPERRWQICRAKASPRATAWTFHAQAADVACAAAPARAWVRDWPQGQGCGTRAPRSANEWPVDRDPHHTDRVCHRGCLYESLFVSDPAGGYHQYRATGDVCQPSAAHPAPVAVPDRGG